MDGGRDVARLLGEASGVDGESFNLHDGLAYNMRKAKPNSSRVRRGGAGQNLKFSREETRKKPNCGSSGYNAAITSIPGGLFDWQFRCSATLCRFLPLDSWPCHDFWTRRFLRGVPGVSWSDFSCTAGDQH
jgi:hypothetical protein